MVRSTDFPCFQVVWLLPRQRWRGGRRGGERRRRQQAWQPCSCSELSSLPHLSNGELQRCGEKIWKWDNLCLKQNIVGTKTPASGLLGSSGFPRLRAGSVILDTTALAQRPPGDQRRGLDWSGSWSSTINMWKISLHMMSIEKDLEE